MEGEVVVSKWGGLWFKLGLILTLILSQIPLYASAAVFNDVNNKHWAKDVIEEWDEKGYVAGYPDGNFYPNKEVSRAEFVAFIGRSLRDEVPESDSASKQFHDVKPSDWFYKDVMWAAKHKIVSGYADGSFQPAKSITREEVAAILYNIKKFETGNDNLQTFQDAQSVSSWSKAAVNQIVGQKVMNGFPDGTFKPLKLISRAESVVSLNNLRSLLDEPEIGESGIRGKVLKEEAAISGAVVKVYEKDGYDVIKQASTKADGSFRIALDGGDYDVVVEKDNLIGYLSDITVKNNEVKQNITLTKAVKVTGKIIFDSKQQAKDAKVIFTTNPSFTTSVDEEGHYSLFILPNSKYSIRVAVKNQTKLLDFDVQIGNSDTKLKDYKFTTLSESTSTNSSSSSSSDNDDNDNNSRDEDTTAPSVTIQSPTTAEKYGTFVPKVTLAGTASDNVELASIEFAHYAVEGAVLGTTTPDTIAITTSDTITVNPLDGSLKGMATGIANGKEQWTIENLNLYYGKNIVKVTAKDASGNQSSDNIEIYFDSEMLSIIIKSPTEADFYATDQSLTTISGVANAKSTVEKVAYTVSDENDTIYEDGDAAGTTDWSISDLTLRPGLSTVMVTVHDDLELTTSDTITILNRVDNDQDFIPDYEEPEYGTNPANPDSDGDGLLDGLELEYGLDPTKSDSDGNGTSDGQEDLDHDNLTNINEQAQKTQLDNPDTDFDGLEDGEEITRGTNPLEADTDGDKLNDGDEIKLGTNPTNPDTDGDGILDGDETYDVETIFEGSLTDEKVLPSVRMNIKGEFASTTRIQNVEGENALIDDQMPGNLGAPYDFRTEADFDTAVMTFAYDTSLDTGSDFEPAIYYFNEEEGLFEELANQSIDRENGTVSATVTHFSKYLLLNKKKWDEVWNKEILKPRPDDGESDVQYIDIVFAIDSSGSMSSNDREGLRKKAVINFINTLLEKDRGAIVDFDSYASVKVELTTDHQELIVAVNSINASGGTNLNVGLNEAINELLKNGKNSTKYVIFLTDGVGSYNKNTLQPAIDNNITIYTVGLGRGVNDTILQEIADLTGGKYYFASTADDLDEKFGDVSDRTTGPKYEDLDGDNLSDYEEVNGIRLNNGMIITTDPTNPDTDGDGIKDGDELGRAYKTSDDKNFYEFYSYPHMPDSDRDGLLDGEESRDRRLVYDFTPKHSIMFSQLSYVNMERYADHNYSIPKIAELGLEDEITDAFTSHLTKKDDINNIFKDGLLKEFYHWRLIEAEDSHATPLSGFGALAAKHGNKIVIAYRGTDGSPGWDNLNDWANDAGIGLFNNNAQAKDAKRFAATVILNNPDSEIYVVGHSLGGWLAQVVSYHLEENKLDEVYPFWSGGTKKELRNILSKDDAYQLTRTFNAAPFFEPIGLDSLAIGAAVPYTEASSNAYDDVVFNYVINGDALDNVKNYLDYVALSVARLGDEDYFNYNSVGKAEHDLVNFFDYVDQMK